MTLNILPMAQVTGSLIMPFGSFLTPKTNPKILIALGEIFALAMLLLTTFMDSFTLFTVFYVIGFGAQNFVYMIPVHHGWLWFPGRMGLISGIIIGGYGLGAFLFDNVATKVINPDNLPLQDNGWYPESVNERFRKMLYVLIASWAVISVIGFAGIFQGPEKRPETNDAGHPQ